ERPHVGVADGFPRVVLPGLVADIARAGDGAEGPEPLAGADVEASHVADRHGLADREAQYRGPDHDDVADDDRRRGVAVEPAVRDGPGEALREDDPTPWGATVLAASGIMNAWPVSMMPRSSAPSRQ